MPVTPASNINEDKLKKVRAATEKRVAVVPFVEGVEAEVHAARISQSAASLQLLSEFEDNLVSLIAALLDKGMDEDQKTQYLVTNLMSIVVKADAQKFIEIVQQSCDVPLDEPGVPPAAVALIVAKWLTLTFDPEINGPFVESMQSSMPPSIRNLFTEEEGINDQPNMASPMPTSDT